MVLLVVFGSGVLTGRALYTPAPERPPSAAEATPPPLGSQTRPIVLGESADVGPWRLRVAAVALDGTARVLAANQFNTPPGEGRSFVLVEVVIRRAIPGPGVLRGSIVASLGTPTGARYPLSGECGVLPAPLDAQQPIGTGQELHGQWCWTVPAHDLPKVALRVESATDGEVWFALR